MSAVKLFEWFVYFASFTLSMYALSSVKFETFMNVKVVIKVQLLWLLLSIGLAYVVAQFIFALTIYN